MEELDVAETKLATQLREACDQYGHERDVSVTSNIFFEMAKIYLRRFRKIKKHSPDDARFVMIKLIALIEAAAQRSNEEEFLKKIDALKYPALWSFLQFIPSDSKFSVTNIDENTSFLKKSIDSYREEMCDKLSQITNPYKGLATACTPVDKKKFRSNMKTHCKLVTAGYVKLMEKVYKFSQSILGNPPCKFALMSLGSLSRQEVTTYSDFESFILLDNINEDTLIYFRNLSALAHILIVTLGETIIPAVGISSIKPIGSDGGWYFDAFTKHGISFDGVLPQASKNPLGLQPFDRCSDTDCELINTPGGMVAYMCPRGEADNEKLNLCCMLTNAVLVYGDTCLSEEFLTLAWRKFQYILRQPTYKEEMFLRLKNDVLRYDLSDVKHSKKIDIKRDLYRGISVLLPTIGALCNIKSNSSYDFIRKLKKLKIISAGYKSEVKDVLAIVSYARLVSLQSQTMSVSNDLPTARIEDHVDKTTSSFSKAALIKVFTTGQNFQANILKAVSCLDICRGFESVLPVRMNLQNGNVCARLGMYREAVKSFTKEKEQIVSVKDLPTFAHFQLDISCGLCHLQLKEIEEAYQCFASALRLSEKITIDEREKANLFQCLATCEIRTCEPKRSWINLQKSVKCLKSGDPSWKTGLAMKYFADDLYTVCQAIGQDEQMIPRQIEMLITTGNMLFGDKQFERASECFNTAVDKQQSYYGATQPDTMSILHKISKCYQKLGQFDAGVTKCKEAFFSAYNDVCFKTTAPAVCDTVTACLRRSENLPTCSDEIQEMLEVAIQKKRAGTEGMQRVTAKLYHAKAVVNKKQKDYSAAAQSYNKELEIYQQYYSPTGNPIIGKVQRAIAQCHKIIGDSEAENEYISMSFDGPLVDPGKIYSSSYSDVFQSKTSLRSLVDKALKTKSVSTGLKALTHATIITVYYYMKTFKWLPGLDDIQLLSILSMIFDQPTALGQAKNKDIVQVSLILECIYYISRTGCFTSTNLQNFIEENINSVDLTQITKAILNLSLGNHYKHRSMTSRALELYEAGSQIEQTESNSYTSRISASLHEMMARCMVQDHNLSIKHFSEALYVLFSNYDSNSEMHNNLMKIEILLGQSMAWLTKKKYKQSAVAVQHVWRLLHQDNRNSPGGINPTIVYQLYLCFFSCAAHDEQSAKFLVENVLRTNKELFVEGLYSGTVANKLLETVDIGNLMKLIEFTMQGTSKKVIAKTKTGIAQLLVSSLLSNLKWSTCAKYLNDLDGIVKELFMFVLFHPECKASSSVLHKTFAIEMKQTDQVFSDIIDSYPINAVTKYIDVVRNHFKAASPKNFVSCFWDVAKYLKRQEKYEEALGLFEQLVDFIQCIQPLRNTDYKYTCLLCMVQLDAADCYWGLLQYKAMKESFLMCLNNAKDVVATAAICEIVKIKQEVMVCDIQTLTEIWKSMTQITRSYLEDSFDWNETWEKDVETKVVAMNETVKFPTLLQIHIEKVKDKEFTQTYYDVKTAVSHIIQIPHLMKEDLETTTTIAKKAENYETKPKELLPCSAGTDETKPKELLPCSAGTDETKPKELLPCSAGTDETKPKELLPCSAGTEYNNKSYQLGTYGSSHINKQSTGQHRKVVDVDQHYLAQTGTSIETTSKPSGCSFYAGNRPVPAPRQSIVQTVPKQTLVMNVSHTEQSISEQESTVQYYEPLETPLYMLQSSNAEKPLSEMHEETYDTQYGDDQLYQESDNLEETYDTEYGDDQVYEEIDATSDTREVHNLPHASKGTPKKSIGKVKKIVKIFSKH
ncbi:uncharacterized protein LOC144744352 [Ciona intestinalis]